MNVLYSNIDIKNIVIIKEKNMLDKLLQSNVYDSLKSLNFNGIQEIRIRANKPMLIGYFNKYYYLGESGLVSEKRLAFIPTKNDIENIILRSCNNSLYAINEDLKKGFVSLSDGTRIGICGQVVAENEQVITVKNFSSVNIRIPHEIKGVADKILPHLVENNEFLNTLIISPPNAGKTTMLRDLVRQIADEKYVQNVLIIDDRNEISGTKNGVSMLDVGLFTDIVCGENKIASFENAVRSMSPDIIATDELGTINDIKAVEYASTCGIKIIATVHSKNLQEFKVKNDFKNIINNQIFERYIVLSSKKGKGTIEGIYNQNFEKLS